jgi:hypothetical protein
MIERTPPLLNPTWEELVASDPLIAFSWYLSGRKNCVLKLGREILAELDDAFSGSVIDGGQLARAEMLMWFWTLGAYEVIRTMCQARNCFSPQLYAELKFLREELTQARIPAAKMEQPRLGRKTARPVTSNRSPADWNEADRDLLIGDPTTSMISARHLVTRFEVVITGITPADIVARHEDSYS